jgi:hypothetical protein
MLRCISVLGCIAVSTACFTQHKADGYTSRAWRGKSKQAILAQWGNPETNNADSLTWSETSITHNAARVDTTVTVVGNTAYGTSTYTPASTIVTRRSASARLSPEGTVLDTSTNAPYLWGPPGRNMRTGMIMGIGLGAAQGRVTSDIGFAGHIYMGGMVLPKLGIIGLAGFASESGERVPAGFDACGDTGQPACFDPNGYVIGLGAQYWLHRMVWLRAVPIYSWGYNAENFMAPDSTYGLAAAAAFEFLSTRMMTFSLALQGQVTTDGFFHPGATVVWGFHNLL